MLRKISGPCSIYIHEDGVYVFEGPRHDVGLQCFSAVTRPLPRSTARETDLDRTQAIIIDADQAAYAARPWGGAAREGSKARDWFVTELIRSRDGDWVADRNTEWKSELVHIAKKPARCTSPHIENKRKRTSDVLGRDHDEDLVVPAAHEKVVEDLKEEKKSGEDTKVVFLPPPPEAQAELDRVKQLLAAQAAMCAACPPGGR